MAPPCEGRLCETENRQKSFGYSSSTASLFVRLHCTNAKRIRCQANHNSFPLENWRRPPGRPRTRWMKTTQQDLKSMDVSLNEATDMAQNRPLVRLMSTSASMHSYRCMPEMIEWMNDYLEQIIPAVIRESNAFKVNRPKRRLPH